MGNSLLDFVMALVRDPEAAARYAADPAGALAAARLPEVTMADVNNLIPMVTDSLATAAPGSAARTPPTPPTSGPVVRPPPPSTRSAFTLPARQPRERCTRDRESSTMPAAAAHSATRRPGRRGSRRSIRGRCRPCPPTRVDRPRRRRRWPTGRITPSSRSRRRRDPSRADPPRSVLTPSTSPRPGTAPRRSDVGFLLPSPGASQRLP